MPRKICIVSPDFVGPIKNGGIGTACYWLARFLARQNYQVCALYIGPFTCATYAEARRQYAEHHVDFIALSEIKQARFVYFGIEHQGVISENVYAYLRGQDFDVIHFQDWQANGFACVQAKRMGLAFARTSLVVGVHSPLRWQREGMRVWWPDPVGDCRRDYMEKYAIEQADSVWAPSHAMLNWLAEHKIVPRAKPRVLPYLIEPDAPDASPATYPVRDSGHLVFFGRLETRKGLEVFVAAVSRLLASGQEHGIRRITFLGKVGATQNRQNAITYLDRACGTWREQGVEWKVIDSYDAFQAIRFIQKTGAIAIMPSLLDNYPYTVLECIRHGIPCLASLVGGQPEMLPTEVLFEPTVPALAEALTQRAERLTHMRGLYSAEQAKRGWIEYARELDAASTAAPPSPKVAPPRVSVCVAYYNYGAYLPMLLQSLQENDYPNFEVVVVNDGSTDSASIDVFEEQKKRLQGRGWKFLTQANQGIGATRNFAAGQATGEYLIFMDADNVATPQMISIFVQAMLSSGADALTCIATVFKGHDYPTAETPVFYLYRPLGPVLEMGLLENVFGDANAIMRKAAFDAIGGFRTDRSTSYEDWELLALLALKGFSLDVVPEPLFYYRHLAEGFSRTTSAVQNQQRVLRAYLAHPDKIDLKSLYNDLLIPLFFAKQPVVMAPPAKAGPPAAAPGPSAGLTP